MYFVKTPKFIQSLFPNFTWNVPNKEKTVYLTFDDGPIAEVTPWVLEQLSNYNAKATFFCVGDNVKKHPQIFEQIQKDGHTVGNHTFNHLNGWTTDHITYLHNVRNCAHLVKSNLFRPPYGKLRPKQTQFLERHYRIVMWDVLSGDWDPNITKEQCLQNVLKHTKAGSIVVLHDSLKSEEKLRYVLPRVLEELTTQGYKFEALKNEMEQELKKSA